MAKFSEKNIIASIKVSVEILRFFSEYNKDKAKDDQINTKIGISIERCIEIFSIDNPASGLMEIPVDASSRIQSLARSKQIIIDNEMRKKISILTKNIQMK